MTTHRTDPAAAPGSDEHYVRELLDSAMSGTLPPHDLPSTALAEGRRLRARRRATLTATAVAASAAVGLGAPWLLGAGDAPVGGSDVTATQPPASAPEMEAPPGWWDTPSRTMVAELTDALPDGVILVDTGRLDADTADGGSGRAVIHPTLATDMGGETVIGNVSLTLRWFSETKSVTLGGGGGIPAIRGLPDALTCPGDLVAPMTCTEIRDPDGGSIGRRSVSVIGGVQVFEVALASGDGIVSGATANTDDETWDVDSPVTAPRPPLTMSQLETIVRNEVWTSYGQ